MHKSNLSIATVANMTGIAKEVLRKWESRYGFPVPKRDAAGNRVYSLADANRLAIVKRLLDKGMRPSQVVALDEPALRALDHAQPARLATADSGAAGQLIGWLQMRDPSVLHARLRAEMFTLGLGPFVLHLMPMMNRLVGEAWASGQIAMRDEHLYTEIVQALVRSAISEAEGGEQADRPCILLATPPGEIHTLGILMVQTLLTLEGARCISLGAQLPLAEIVLAAQEYRAGIVGLSFSASFPLRKIIPLLKELRALLPEHVSLWAGGAVVASLESTPRGVVLLPDLADVLQALQKHQQRSSP